MITMTRRVALLSAATFFLAPLPVRAAPAQFYRDPGCGCCHNWVEHMRANGFDIQLSDTDDLTAVHNRFGVPEALQGCHVGELAGYVISGHVPAEDIKRLLAEKPSAAGLAVPGMPVGSPGMESGGAVDAYQVIQFQADGTTSVYASHG